MPESDDVLLSDAVLVGHEHENRRDNVAEAKSRQKDLGNMRRNGATGCARVDASPSCVNAEEEVQGRDLSDSDELVDGEDGEYGNQRVDVAISIPFDRPDVDNGDQVDQEVEALDPLVGIGTSDLLRKGPYQDGKKVVNRWEPGIIVLRDFA